MTRFLLLLAFLLIPTQAFACSVVRGYRTPTNFELVQKATLIVLARVVSGPDEMNGWEPAVEIEPVRVLKGVLPAGKLMIEGSLTAGGDPVPSMPTPLATAHISTTFGACIRMTYPKGGLVLAMFRPAGKGDDAPAGMVQISDPFARAVEDVESADGVWVKAAMAYVALQAGSDKAHLRGTVEREQAALAARTDDLVAQAMARDLAYYLDMTGGGKDRLAKAMQWRFFDLPDETGAIIGSDTLKGIILHCRKGGDAVEVYWPQEEGEATALRLGAQDFALTPAKLTLSPDLNASSATLALDGRLREALASGTGPAGIATAKRVEAPPLDVLQKFGLRCEALLKP